MTDRRMRDGATTDDYRNACSGEGEFGSLGHEWTDKPHRLVYDLCGEIEILRKLLLTGLALHGGEAHTHSEKEWREEARAVLGIRT